MFTLPVMDVPLECISKAAVTFHVQPLTIMSIIMTEGGHVGEVSKNKNGSYDIGPMQINSSWLPHLRQYNISREDILYNRNCSNIFVGTWILAKGLSHSNDFLVGIGDYNSHTKHFNKAYYEKVRINYTRLKVALE